ncbi:MAG: hypothetical protein AAFO57_08950, partial [Pseudomonadota bacterium]
TPVLMGSEAAFATLLRPQERRQGQGRRACRHEEGDLIAGNRHRQTCLYRSAATESGQRAH